MKLSYRSCDEVLRISEQPNGADVEFDIQIVDEKMLAEMKKVQHYFEDNKVYTDVLFYPYEHKHYRVIVRKDYYADFILALLKQRLLEGAEWQ